MSSTYNKSHQLKFVLEILKILAEQPLKKSELMIKLGDRGFEAGDLEQKITRTISKLRDCGFQITSAPNCPYTLLISTFPIILSQEQKEALVIASELLANLGFTTEAGHIYQIANLHQQPKSFITTDFHPPTNYSQEKINQIIEQLQDRLKRKRRFVTWYRNSKGEEKWWDLDKSELRLHNGVLYVFALIPTFRSRNIDITPNAEQNVLIRVDRITRIGAASETPWIYSKFPTLDITYRLMGDLAKYKPRRTHEHIISPPEITEYVDILTQEDCIFWFRQRILQYGGSARVLSPDWVVKDVQETLKKAYDNYCVEFQ
ncbi:MAG: helix-turn-helix transcriptional regulator [Cuspidothrix sp.]